MDGIGGGGVLAFLSRSELLRDQTILGFLRVSRRRFEVGRRKQLAERYGDGSNGKIGSKH